jgi:hypothetical protein
LIEVLRIDSCKPTVVLEHSVGCPAYTVAGLTKFLTKQFWIPGLSMICLGLWIMHEGRFWFRSLTAVISFLLFFQIYFLTMVYYHTPESIMARFALSMLGSMVITFTIYWFSNPEKNNFYIDIIFMGLLGGFLSGLMVCLTLS